MESRVRPEYADPAAPVVGERHHRHRRGGGGPRLARLGLPRATPALLRRTRKTATTAANSVSAIAIQSKRFCITGVLSGTSNEFFSATLQ